MEAFTASATPSGGSAATASATVAFGAGPLAKFKAPLSNRYQWSTDVPVTSATTNFPAAEACGGTVSYIADGYYVSSKLPRQDFAEIVCIKPVAEAKEVLNEKQAAAHIGQQPGTLRQ